MNDILIMFSLVLVCLENFQEYILTNIAQLLRLGHTEIYVLTNQHLFHEFEPFNDILKLVDVETLEDPFDFKGKSTLDKDFRGGFWFNTSARFFVIHAFMLKHGVKDVIHIENDVLLYYNVDEELAETFTEQKLYIPFDTYERNIASIVYIPDADVFSKILEHYDFGKNDMYNFSEIRKRTQLIQNLPIFVNDEALAVGRDTALVGRDTALVGRDTALVGEGNALVGEGNALLVGEGNALVGEGNALERAFVSNGFKKYIFDAAAIGQLVGGVDPRNAAGDTRGFVNETCVIKYKEEGEIIWREVDGFNKPFIKIFTKEVPIFNLHIHCKNLSIYC